MESLRTPETLTYFAPENRGRIRSLGSIYWQELRDANNQIVGRYTALLEDHSGLLDINALVPSAVANPQKRTNTGRDCLRLRISTRLRHSMPTRPLLNWGSALPTPQIGHLVNAAEIRQFATEVEVASPNPAKGKLFTNFSRNPVAACPADLNRPTMDRLEITRFAQVDPLKFRQHLTALGFDSKELKLPGNTVLTQSQILWDAFVDYTDDNSQVTNPYVSNEAVAMLSELTLPVKITKTTPTPGNPGFPDRSGFLGRIAFPFCASLLGAFQNLFPEGWFHGGYRTDWIGRPSSDQDHHPGRR